MKTALYGNKFKKILNQQKLVRLIKNTIFSLFFTQSSIMSADRYNITLFLSSSMIFLHYSAMACSLSDNNTTCWYHG